MDRPSSLPAVLRSIAWVTSVAAMVVCGYILHKWPQYGNAVATGVVGIAIAMLNDSWQMVASAERLADFPMLAPARLLLHDVFALVVTVGGILLLVFMGTDESDRSHLGDELKTTASETDDEFSKDVMIRKAVWFMVAVCIWRVGFMITETWRCLRIIQRRRYLLARRRALGLV